MFFERLIIPNDLVFIQRMAFPHYLLHSCCCCKCGLPGHRYGILLARTPEDAPRPARHQKYCAIHVDVGDLDGQTAFVKLISGFPQ